LIVNIISSRMPNADQSEESQADKGGEKALPETEIKISQGAAPPDIPARSWSLFAWSTSFNAVLGRDQSRLHC
jgi:hypothetical protein